MKSTILNSIAIIFLTPLFLAISCGKTELNPTEDTELKTIEHDGRSREYLIHVPSSYENNQPVALLISFHGYGNTANEIMELSKLNDIADTNNFIVVYPQGLTFQGVTHWNVGGFTNGSTLNDVGFINSLLDELAGKYNINTNKIYACGESNGGFMSFLLACQLSDRIAAIASVIGSMTPEMYNACQPNHQMPILQLHGTSDDLVPYQGQSDMIAIETVLSFWKTYNLTDSVASIIQIPDIAQNDNSTVERYFYGNGINGSSVIHYKVINGGHDWFGAQGNMDIQSSQIVWDFLSKYDINGEL
jgi:polyhydroxybutyrate depolymerase